MMVDTFDEDVRRELGPCPGGRWCTCCRPGCDCGCRDDCLAFRAAVRRRLKFRSDGAAKAREKQ